MTMKEPEFETFQASLLRWFDASARDLPWRRNPSPYAVWISEIMLQQTQVKTVLPYFLRWMKRFPDVEVLSRATSEEILKHWEGMGYYSRAESIRRTALELAANHGGALPRSYDELLKLPGIGPYTAGAIMSFAFNEPCPVLDVNVERVLVRVFNIEGRVKEASVHKLLVEKALRLIPEGNSGGFNQAMMELGATVCSAQKPRCPECPVRRHCESLRLGVVDHRPEPDKPKRTTPLQVAIGVLAHDGGILIQKRPPTGLMAGLWEFPGGKVEPGETPEDALEREFLEELELGVHAAGKIATIRHSYTSFKVTLHAFDCRLRDGGRRDPVLHSAVEARWVEPGALDEYAFPSANRKLINLLKKGDRQTKP
ncbi:MAG: A/G-specific adenine glycosylase [Syntrophobacteraceae bacterium]